MSRSLAVLQTSHYGDISRCTCAILLDAGPETTTGNGSALRTSRFLIASENVSSARLEMEMCMCL